MRSLRLGVIGVGRFGQHYVRLLPTLPRVQLAGVAGRTSRSLEVLRGKLPPATRRYPTAAALLADATIDGVVIATPAATHALVATAAIAASKHVLVEKPMTTSVAEARQLAHAAVRSRRVLMVGHQYCYHDHVRWLRRYLRRGTIGELRAVLVEHRYVSPARADVGVFWDAATHELAILDFLVGLPRITAVRGIRQYVPGARHEVLTAAAVAFAGRWVASMVHACHAQRQVRTITFLGARGSAVFDDGPDGPRLTLLAARPPDRPARPIVPAVAAREPLKNELEHFVRCVRSGRPPLTDVAHGVKMTNYLDQIFRQLTPLGR